MLIVAGLLLLPTPHEPKGPCGAGAKAVSFVHQPPQLPCCIHRFRCIHGL
jgi:hypothetical protein